MIEINERLCLKILERFEDLEEVGTKEIENVYYTSLGCNTCEAFTQ